SRAGWLPSRDNPRRAVTNMGTRVPSFEEKKICRVSYGAGSYGTRGGRNASLTPLRTSARYTVAGLRNDVNEYQTSAAEWRPLIGQLSAPMAGSWTSRAS